MLNEWVFDARLMEQEVTKFFIPLYTDTTLIDWPIDSVASIRLLFVVRLSVSALSLALYILKSGVLLQGYRPIVTYDYSLRTNHVNAGVNGFFRGCPLFSSKHAHLRVGFSDYRSF
jgi:hypothetical protein